MNYTTAIFLISDEVKMHAVVFAPDDPNGYGKVRRYHYKTFEKELLVGQYVVVPSSLTDKKTHGMSVAKIVELDVEVDFECSLQYKWIVASLNMMDFESIKLKEGEALSAIRSAEKTRKRRELKADLMADAGAELKKLGYDTGTNNKE